MHRAIFNKAMAYNTGHQAASIRVRHAPFVAIHINY